MKKLMLMTAVIVLTGMAGFTQSFEKGSQAFNLDVGFVNTPYFTTSEYEGFYPSASISYEYGIVSIPMGTGLTGVVSVGPYAGFCTTRYNFFDNGDHYSIYDVDLGLRGNYHFIFHEKLDTYAGVWIGANITNHVWNGDWEEPEGIYFAHGTGLAAGAYAGVRWFFTDILGVNAEVCWLMSVVNVGVTFKIN